MLVTKGGFSVYAWDRDGPNKSNCDVACLKTWLPVLAPETTYPRGEWTVIEPTPGIKQWSFRGRPLYTHIPDRTFGSMEGSDVAGWSNVYTQRAPAPPKGFTVQDARSGQVLADSRGMTLYTYICTDDALDQQSCDHPDTQQAYRFAICGGNDPARCAATFPYVLADKDAVTTGHTWSVMDIDPMTGKRAKAGQAGALRVWAYRDRPVYTFARDRKAGDIGADAWGEFNGWRNGFKAFWIRDDFFNNAG
jgi:predicted lipoprotein with Yx(FWY)xxD motif